MANTGLLGKPIEGPTSFCESLIYMNLNHRLSLTPQAYLSYTVTIVYSQHILDLTYTAAARMIVLARCGFPRKPFRQLALGSALFSMYVQSVFRI